MGTTHIETMPYCLKNLMKYRRAFSKRSIRSGKIFMNVSTLLTLPCINLNMIRGVQKVLHNHKWLSKCLLQHLMISKKGQMLLLCAHDKTLDDIITSFSKLKGIMKEEFHDHDVRITECGGLIQKYKKKVHQLGEDFIELNESYKDLDNHLTEQMDDYRQDLGNYMNKIHNRLLLIESPPYNKGKK